LLQKSDHKTFSRSSKLFFFKTQNASILHPSILAKCMMPILEGKKPRLSGTGSKHDYGSSGRLAQPLRQTSSGFPPPPSIACAAPFYTSRCDIAYLCDFNSIWLNLTSNEITGPLACTAIISAPRSFQFSLLQIKKQDLTVTPGSWMRIKRGT